MITKEIWIVADTNRFFCTHSELYVLVKNILKWLIHFQTREKNIKIIYLQQDLFYWMYKCPPQAIYSSGYLVKCQPSLKGQHSSTHWLSTKNKEQSFKINKRAAWVNTSEQGRLRPRGGFTCWRQTTIKIAHETRWRLLMDNTTWSWMMKEILSVITSCGHQQVTWDKWWLSRKSALSAFTTEISVIPEIAVIWWPLYPTFLLCH